MASENLTPSTRAKPTCGSPALENLLRTAAYETWAAWRGDDRDCSIAFFNEIYLGHYSHIEDYVETLVDSYQLDSRLDAAIAEPYRQFIDVDVTALAQSFVRSGTLHALQAIPVGVWVFNGEME